jgi:predicted Zn finger-like uncharacterized protein
MHIVCPHCTTSYAVDPANFGAAGRKVRCARCQEVWLAVPQELVSATEYGSGPAGATPHEDFGARDNAADSWREDNAPHVESPRFPPDGRNLKPHTPPLTQTGTGPRLPGRRP